jgi:ADP-ribose pyrophosphatase YjhB (NUDIX family)
MKNTVQSFYGNRLRVRVCGICVHDDSLLMVNHQGISEGDFWAPPGGGIEFGESAEGSLQRELAEETGLDISIQKFLFAVEFVHPPLHAIELFFRVGCKDFTLKTGSDPEEGSPAIIKDVRLMPWNEILALPPSHRHGIFTLVDHPSSITALNGYFKI